MEKANAFSIFMYHPLFKEVVLHFPFKILNENALFSFTIFLLFMMFQLSFKIIFN